MLLSISEQIATGNGDFGGETSEGFHALCLAEPLFQYAQPREIVCDYLDETRRQRTRGETHEQAAAVLTPPCGFDGFFGARADAPFDQP